MKNTIQTAGWPLLFILFAAPLSAQRNALRITPFQPMFGKFSVQYERKIESHTSLVLEWQKWATNRRVKDGSALLALISPAWVFLATPSNTKIRAEGFMFSATMRRYGKNGVFKSVFFEGGINIGKLDLKQVAGGQGGTFLWGSSGSAGRIGKRADNLPLSGIKLGAGIQRTRGRFNWEFSGGMLLQNVSNVAADIAPKQVGDGMAYTRFAMGMVF